MAIGSFVRRMFGPHERLVSELWRSAFIDLDMFIAQVRDWTPSAHNILEIGCGEGAGTQRLAAAYPDATILAIDIADNLGRLYDGRAEGVTFRQITVQQLARTEAAQFDLIIMCDVLHHIPPELRAEIVAATRLLLAPGGSFVLKDWERTATPIHWLSHAADRWLTGDRVRYPTRVEAETLLASGFGDRSVCQRAAIRPWRNNFALLLQPGA
jgi:2-polyprenyl-6-hydroxyphenyl methylase/3-demethylubiquinone-9 3-methyltransferase